MRKTQDSVKLGAALRELAAVGCIVDLSVAEVPEENTVEIHQGGGVHESMVFELPDGRAGYILDLEVVNQSSKTIYCCETELRMPWEDALFDWLPDPKETGRTFSYFRRRRNGRRERVDAASTSYCFSGGAQLEYPRDLVLNHIMVKGCALRPRCPLKGLLLASGGPMPYDLHHGQWLEPTLSITSSSHVAYTAKVDLWVDRLQAKPNPARKHYLREEPVGTVGSTVEIPGQPSVAFDSGTLLIRSGAVHSVGAGTTDPCERVNNK
jgi:hypothetical protein